ncbi:hypothetical protein C5470_20685 [Photorhabdus stackebrandtii]|uniref:Uncharacterized protein n=1 Tax=Photorhabdus stackebrandtii TaxID=1123042 RepID=A0A7X5QQD3_9GAMM|nr:hypothetical protein [Photorhabdus stackebrandtii]
MNKAIITMAKPLTRSNLERIFSATWAVVQGDKKGVENKGRYTTWTGHSARVGARAGYDGIRLFSRSDYA